MTAPAPVLEVIRAATGQGVALSVTPDARLHAEGPKEALERHLPTLRARKPEIIAALKACRAHGATLSPAHWQIRYAARLVQVRAEYGDRVHPSIVDATAYARVVWEWQSENLAPMGTYDEATAEHRLATARRALTAAGVKPHPSLEALDMGHAERLRSEGRAEGRAEGALEFLDDLTERWGQMCGGPEYPDDAHALVAALEDVRGRYWNI
jgi:hypothetical protein